MSLFTATLIIPTGIGAHIGGFAGDALPIARVCSEICDRVITHPNVMNGAQLYWPLKNALYVEGYGLDQFLAGHWQLTPVRQNRVGLLLDEGIEDDLKLRHIQAAEATRATLGLTLTDYVVTDAPLNVQLQTSASGASWGTIGNPDSLLRAAAKLIEQAGATAIAIVVRFPEIEESVLQFYRQGSGVDPLAGAEAVISHLVVREFQIPAAHAPALDPLPVDPSVSPRAAAEELGYTFLPCVLVGLSRAPQFTMSVSAQSFGCDRVNALIVPADACGGSGTLSFASSGGQIIAVTENRTEMTVSPEALGLNALRVHSYFDALGVLAALKSGVDPQVLRANFPVLSRLD
ncbi:MAG: DUF3326 domain-containing protein [Cyanobacteria bacterium P01_H01_bin.15]